MRTFLFVSGLGAAAVFLGTPELTRPDPPEWIDPMVVELQVQEHVPENCGDLMLRFSAGAPNLSCVHLPRIAQE